MTKHMKHFFTGNRIKEIKVGEIIVFKALSLNKTKEFM